MALDFGGGFGVAVHDGGLERGVVELVLVGVGFGEVGDGLVERDRAAEVGGQRNAVTGAEARGGVAQVEAACEELDGGVMSPALGVELDSGGICAVSDVVVTQFGFRGRE